MDYRRMGVVEIWSRFERATRNNADQFETKRRLPRSSSSGRSASMKMRLIVAAACLCFLGVPRAPAQEPDQFSVVRAMPKPDVIVQGDSCKKRMRKGCQSAAQISRYGVKTYWEVVYVVIDGKWILAEESPYSATLDVRCGHEAYAFLKKITPVSDRRVPSVLSTAQDHKEACELAQIQADGLEAVNLAMGVSAKAIEDYRVFRIAKDELKNAPPEAQAMLAPWIALNQD
jgi:hypothetical protein